MLGVNLARVVHLNQFPHHREHIHIAFIDEAFDVFLIRLDHVRIAVMHVIDAIAAAEVAAHLDRIFAQLARYAAIEGDPIGRTVHDFNEVLPPGQGGHDLL